MLLPTLMTGNLCLWCNAISGPHTNLCPSPLEVESGTSPWLKCHTGYNWNSFSGHSYNLVLKYGSHTHERWLSHKNWTLPLWGKPITHNPHIIRSPSFWLKQGKQFWTHRTGTTTYYFPQVHKMPLYLSQNGAGTGIFVFPRDFTFLETDILVSSTI